MGHPKGVSPKRVMEVGLMGWGPEKGNGSGLWSCGGVVYVEGLPSSRVPEEGGHNVEGIWRGESKYGHKIRKVSSTSIKIVGKAVNSSRVKCLGLENTVDRLGEPIQKPVKRVTFSSLLIKSLIASKPQLPFYFVIRYRHLVNSFVLMLRWNIRPRIFSPKSIKRGWPKRTPTFALNLCAKISCYFATSVKTFE